MTRIIPAVISALASILVLAAGQGKPQAERDLSFASAEYRISHIDGRHYRWNLLDGTFSFKGAPRIHAELPKRGIVMDANQIDGVIDPRTHTVESANLTGGVTGSMTSQTADGAERVTFAGTRLDYVNAGTAAQPGANVEAFDDVVFTASNKAEKSHNPSARHSLSLAGSHGTFQLRSAADGRIMLVAADLDGPVRFSFSGIAVQRDRQDRSKVTRTPVAARGQSDHLSITRKPDGASYVMRATGGVNLHGTSGPLEGADLATESLSLEFDERGNLLSIYNDDQTTTTIPTGRHST